MSELSEVLNKATEISAELQQLGLEHGTIGNKTLKIGKELKQITIISQITKQIETRKCKVTLEECKGLIRSTTKENKFQRWEACMLPCSCQMEAIAEELPAIHNFLKMISPDTPKSGATTRRVDGDRNTHARKCCQYG